MGEVSWVYDLEFCVSKKTLAVDFIAFRNDLIVKLNRKVRIRRFL